MGLNAVSLEPKHPPCSLPCGCFSTCVELPRHSLAAKQAVLHHTGVLEPSLSFVGHATHPLGAGAEGARGAWRPGQQEGNGVSSFSIRSRGTTG